MPAKNLGPAELVQGANIEGNLFIDTDSSCTLDISDEVLKKTLIEFDNGTENVYTYSKSNGQYEISVLPGNYTVNYYLTNSISSIAPCSGMTVIVLSTDTTIAGLNIPVHFR